MKEKTGRRILSLIVSLALMVGMMQGMTMTARAEYDSYTFSYMADCNRSPAYPIKNNDFRGFSFGTVSSLQTTLQVTCTLTYQGLYKDLKDSLNLGNMSFNYSAYGLSSEDNIPVYKLSYSSETVYGSLVAISADNKDALFLSDIDHGFFLSNNELTSGGERTFRVSKDMSDIIAAKTQVNPQTEPEIDTKVEDKDDTPKTTVENLTKDVVLGFATDAEKTAINNGQNAVVTFEIKNIDKTVGATEKQIMESAVEAISPNARVGTYFDFSMFFKAGTLDRRKVTDLKGKSIGVKVSVPSSIKAPAGVNRTYYLLSIHNNISKVLGSSTTDVIPATITEFSTYAIAYADENGQLCTSINVKQSGGKIKISWDKTNAKKMEVYLSYCGKKFSKKPVKTTGGTSVTIKKIDGKKINFKKNFKIYLVGYDSNGNKIGKTVNAHIVGKDNKKYTNVKSIKVKNAKVTVAKGQSAKVSASVKLDDKKKKMLSEDHAKKFRFASTNKAIATVDDKGRITGVSAGTCDVYVFAVNGLAKKVAVTVTE